MTTASSGPRTTCSIGDEGDRDQVDHRPVLGAGDHAVDGQDDRLARLAEFEQGLEPEHAGQGVGVGVDVRDEDDAGERGEGRQEAFGAVLPGQDGLRVGLGHHRGRTPIGTEGERRPGDEAGRRRSAPADSPIHRAYASGAGRSRAIGSSAFFGAALAAGRLRRSRVLQRARPGRPRPRRGSRGSARGRRPTP